MSANTEDQPAWPAYPGIPNDLRPPPAAVAPPRPGLLSPDAYNYEPNQQRRGFSPGQLYAAISASRRQANSQGIDTTNQTLRVPTSITITNDQGVQRGHYVGLGIDQLHAQPDPYLSPVGVSRTSSVSSRSVHKVVEEEQSRDWASRLEKKIWQYNRSSSMGKRWLMEIISWVISAMCMSAIIIVLIYYHDKPLRSWKFLISPNAYISVLSRIATSALLFPVAESLGQLKWSWFRNGSKKLWDFEIFDNASRGPWGSFMLLIRAKRSLAALGAFLMIVSLALDPFFQQVFTFEDRMVLLSQNSTIPRADVVLTQIPTITRNGAELIMVNSGFEDVAQKFYFGNGTTPIPAGVGFRPDVPLSCATEHCRWGSYETLAVCSKCKPMVHKMEWTCLFGEVDWSRDSNVPQWLKFMPSAGPNRNRTMCGWFLNATSSSPVLMNGFAQSPNSSLPEEILLTRILPLTNQITRVPFYNGVSPAFPDIRHPIGDFFYVTSADGSTASVLSSTYPIAEECAVYWCVQNLTSSYDAGHYVENITSEYHNTEEKEWPWVPADDGRIPNFMPNITMISPTSGTKFQVSNYTHIKALIVIEEISPSMQTTFDIKTDSPWLRFVISGNTGSRKSRLDPKRHNPFLGRSLGDHLQKMTTQFTYVLRSGDDGITLINGDTSGIQTIIIVKWEWFILPVTILLLSLAFLVGTMIKSAREQQHVGIWKTSAMATLLNGLPGGLQEKLNTDSSDASPFLKAQELRVGLRSNRHGWRLSNALSPIAFNDVEQGNSQSGR